MSKAGPFPHEKKMQRGAYASLAAAVLLGAFLAGRGDASVLGIAVPAVAGYALALLGAILGVIAVARRTMPLALATVLVTGLATVPGARAATGPLDYALGLLFGVALLGFAECVHQTTRYETAHRAVDADGLPEEHLNKVSDEALRTLATRGAYALGVAALCVGLAFLLTVIGPAQWRSAVETTAPLGVALASLALLGAASLSILFTGARFGRSQEAPSPEVVPDVAE